MLLEAFKSIVPADKRRWISASVEWRFDADDITRLRAVFESLGATVTVLDQPREEKAESTSHYSADHWKRKFEAMESAAKSLHEEVVELRDEVERLRAAADRDRHTAASGNWAELLFTTVGAEPAEAAFKTLTKFLHPDRPTGSTTLMQQLNAARDNARRM
ncbi:hypothetical protein [Nocardia sp. NBC_01327]|uniref:hypothetical protein n=1 Tax=Nocardia sp. NBC_01327 TaxID=2903593 RepID=UPI002E0ED51C|nr:hypothetical protein OG326_29070 [Nocardia sp. NBC_01327]